MERIRLKPHIDNEEKRCKIHLKNGSPFNQLRVSKQSGTWGFHSGEESWTGKMSAVSHPELVFPTMNRDLAD